MKILDCTLRDGGYYNNWDFDGKVVSAYLNAVASAGIDFVELGLRSFPRKGFLGAFAYTTEAHLASLDLPEGPEYGVMIDSKTILESGLNPEEAVKSLFVNSSESKVSLVRIAAHFKEVEASQQIANTLKSLGYTVGFNLMQAGGKADEVIAEKAKLIQSWASVDVLYFADSLGNMDGAEVERIIRAIQSAWSGPIGIHTHNNMDKGLDNTLTAMKAGVTWMDSTITGMGRGAGNTPTEYLLATLCRHDSLPYNASPVFDLVVRYFDRMQKDYGWGSNLLYFLGAQNGVHPTYVQNLLADTHYGPAEIVGAIDYLSELEGTESYSSDVLNAALSINAEAKTVSGSGDLVNRFSGQEVLIVNNGPSLLKYLQPVQSYIKNRKPVVLCVNILDEVIDEYVDYYCVSRNNKFLSEKTKYSSVKKPIILPMHRFRDHELSDLPKSCIDYGLNVAPDTFTIGQEYCELPYDLTLAYAIAIAVNGGAQKISLVGVDGYESTDPRQLEMIRLWEVIHGASPGVDISAVTPTSYPIAQESIYAPDL